MNGDSDTGSEAALFDLRGATSAVRRRWWLILALFALAGIIAAILYGMQDTVYSATARVAVERRSEDLVQTDASVPVLTADSAAVDTEVQRLRAPELASAVVDKLKLANDPAFAEVIGGAAAQRKAAINALIARLDIRREGTSFAISISHSGTSAQQSARIVNTLVDLYRSNSVGSQTGERERRVALLSQRLGELRGELTIAERAVAEYRIANNIVDASKDSSVRQSEISALNTELAQARAQEAEAAARLSTARGQLATGRGGDTLASALNSPVVGDLRRQQADLAVRRAELAERYGPRHPDLLRVNEQTQEINARISAEIARTTASLRSEAQAAAGRTSSIVGSIGRAEGAVNAQTAASVRLAELERNAESAQALYRAFLDQYRAATAQVGADSGTASIIARALVPTRPVSPDPWLFAIGALVVGTILSTLVLLLLRLFDDSFESGRDVVRKTGAKLFGSVPDVSSLVGKKATKRDPLSPSDYLIDHQGSAYAEAVRGVRVALENRGAKVVAITSALPGEGKTTLALSLARSAALAGQKVLLIDTDLRRRASSISLAEDVRTGLVDVIADRTKLAQALVQDSRSGAFLLPQTAADTDKYDAITGDRLTALLGDLRDSFDLIVLDTAPVLAVAEARVVAGVADATMLAVRWRKTPASAANLALDLLNEHGARISGIVLTQVDLKAQAREGIGEGAFYGAYTHYYR